MIKKFISLALLLVLCFATIIGCKKDKAENLQTISELYTIYKNGQISECTYKGDLVYSACLNAYDAGSSIYDKNGNIIGTCNYAWSTPDSICTQLQNYVVIYRVDNNIWGKPPVNKYELGK